MKRLYFYASLLALCFSHHLFAPKIPLGTRILEIMARRISEDPYKRGPRTVDLLCSLVPKQLTIAQHETLTKAVSYFSKTPGFSNTLACLIQSEHPAGFFYEIETGVFLQEKGHTIVTFHREAKVPSSRQRREFDLITRMQNTEYWIECKTTRWKEHKRLPQQILDQQLIVQSRARKSDYPVEYKVFSKRPVPNNWQTWFDTNGIAVVEECCSDSDSDTMED